MCIQRMREQPSHKGGTAVRMKNHVIAGALAALMACTSAADAAASVQAASGAADAYRTQRDTAYAGHDKTRGLLYAAKKRIAELEAACSGK